MQAVHEDRNDERWLTLQRLGKWGAVRVCSSWDLRFTSVFTGMASVSGTQKKPLFRAAPVPAVIYQARLDDPAFHQRFTVLLGRAKLLPDSDSLWGGLLWVQHHDFLVNPKEKSDRGKTEVMFDQIWQKYLYRNSTTDLILILKCDFQILFILFSIV